MPLLKGKENIGHNVREMEAHGHPKKQAVAAALATAYDEEEEFNSTKKRQAQNLGAIVSHDETYAKPVTDMTVADINAKNEKLWYNVGPAPTEAAAPALAGTKVGHNVPVYTGAGIGDEGATPKTGAEAYQMGHPKEAAETAERNRKALEQAGKKLAKTHKKADDEVSPTQSAPPDPRSNNLLGEVAVAGEHDAEHQPHPGATSLIPSYGAAVQAEHEAKLKTKEGNAERMKRNEEVVKHMRAGKSGDDLAMNTESMPPEGQADGATRAQKAIKKEVKNEAGRIGSIAARQASEGSESAASTAATAAHYARSAMMGRRRPLSTYKGVKGA